MSAAIRVYVNGAGLEVERSATALDAVRLWSEEAAAGVAAGDRVITDSRGLPVEPSTPLVAGAILRVVSARGRAAGEPPR